MRRTDAGSWCADRFPLSSPAGWCRTRRSRPSKSRPGSRTVLVRKGSLRRAGARPCALCAVLPAWFCDGRLRRDNFLALSGSPLQRRLRRQGVYTESLILPVTPAAAIRDYRAIAHPMSEWPTIHSEPPIAGAMGRQLSLNIGDRAGSDELKITGAPALRRFPARAGSKRLNNSRDYFSRQKDAEIYRRIAHKSRERPGLIYSGHTIELAVAQILKGSICCPRRGSIVLVDGCFLSRRFVGWALSKLP